MGSKNNTWGKNSMYRTIFGQSFHEPFPLYIYARLDALQMLILPNTAVKLLRQTFSHYTGNLQSFNVNIVST